MDEWITTGEAVNISRYNAEYVRRLVRTGKLKARKFGTVWQVSRASLQEYIRETEHSRDRRRGPK